MQGTQVVYLGRSIAKEGFRAFVYGSNGRRKLVNSWDEFEICMASGIWFDSLEHIVEPEAPKEAEPVVEKEDAPKKRSK